MQKERLPDFLIIGAQKSATSWLAHLLRQHPNIYLPANELHFFNNPGPRSKYAALFHEARSNQLIGEKTPDYLHLPKRKIALIKKWMPSIRLIVVLRNPVARSWSQARMEVAAVNSRALTSKDRFWLIWHVHLLRSQMRSDYRSALRRWQQFFPRQHFLVLFYEDLVEDPVTFACRVFDFLEVPPLASETIRALAAQRLWTSPMADIPHWLRYVLTRRYCKQTRWLIDQGYHVPKTWPTEIQVQQLRQETRCLPVKAGILTGIFTLLALPEHLLVYLGRWFPSLHLYRIYDRLQFWRTQRTQHARASTR